MEIDEIKKKIKFAMDAVEGIDKDYKIEAFKIILSRELGISSSTPPKKTETDGTPETPENTHPKIKELTTKLDVSEDELGNIVSISDDKIDIHHTFEGNDKENMINFSQCYLIIKFYVFKSEWVNASEINNAMKKVGIEDTSGNFITYLKNISSIFVKRGKERGKIEVKLVAPKGREIALSTLKNLVNSEN